MFIVTAFDMSLNNNFFEKQKWDLSSNSEEDVESSKSKRKEFWRLAEVGKRCCYHRRIKVSWMCEHSFLIVCKIWEATLKLLEKLQNQHKAAKLKALNNLLSRKNQYVLPTKRLKNMRKTDEKKNVNKKAEIYHWYFEYRQEQFSRRNCLLIHGLEEQNNENTNQRVTDMLHKSMRQTISP